MTLRVPNTLRVRTGPEASQDADGNNGAFLIPAPEALMIRQFADGTVPLPLTVLASDGDGWEHVSVSTPSRCPTWREMDKVKRLFWDDEDTVMQLHPPRSQWISNHPYVLHLWRPVGSEIPLPPQGLVGVPGLRSWGRR